MVLTRAKFKRACESACKKLRELAPNRTGNLAYNAITIEFPSPDECLIYVDESIAPYMPYTNEAWLSPKWNGKKNPNEGWFQKAAQIIFEELASKLGGELK